MLQNCLFDTNLLIDIATFSMVEPWQSVTANVGNIVRHLLPRKKPNFPFTGVTDGTPHDSFHSPDTNFKSKMQKRCEMMLA